MKRIFFRWVIPKSLRDGDPRESAIRHRYGIYTGWTSIAVNILLFITKAAVGLLINSIALLADSFHSLSDVATSVIVVAGYRIARKPADTQHPFGHQRAEYIAALIIAVLLIVAGIEFIRVSVERLSEPPLTRIHYLVLLFIVATILVKFWLGAFTKYTGRLIRSQALAADSLHHYTDSISSILVLIAIGGAKLGFPVLDGIGGIAVGILLIWAGFSIARDAADTLLGKPPAPQLIAKLHNLCQSIEGVLNVHDIIVHSYGDQRFISLHIEVDQKISSAASHDVAAEVEDRVTRELQAHTIAHVDPVDTDSGNVATARVIIERIVHQCPEIREYHDLRFVSHPDRQLIIFDLVPLKKDHEKIREQGCYQRLKRGLADAFPDHRIEINIDPLYIYN